MNSLDDIIRTNWYGTTKPTAATKWPETTEELFAKNTDIGYNEGAGNVIKTPYGDALQSNLPESLALRQYVDNGGKLYRGGNLGRSYVADGQFWAPESPLSPGYADKYGVDFNNLDFIIRGIQMNGAPYITRPAPGLRVNPGGALEVVNNPYSVKLDYFHMK